MKPEKKTIIKKYDVSSILLMSRFGDEIYIKYNDISELLEAYTNFLYSNGYTDSDTWAEEPTAVYRFLEELKKEQ